MATSSTARKPAQGDRESMHRDDAQQGLEGRPTAGHRTGADRNADIVLGAAVVAMGLLAGFFYAYAISVMPGLTDTADRTFVDANQQLIKATNESPLFFLALLGAPALAIWALVNASQADSRLAIRWIVAALVLYGICVLLTGAVHIPLNDDLEKAGNPAQIADLASVADDFEGPWVAWHIVRTIALVGSFAALVGAAFVQARDRPAATTAK